MKKSPLALLLFVLIAAGGTGIWRWRSSHSASDSLTLFGNVDLRDAALAFKREDRIAEVLVEEGARVHKGQVLARLDTSDLEIEIKQREASLNAQNALVRRLENGLRPEEIAQIRAEAESADVQALNAERILERRKKTVGIGASSRENVDDAASALDAAKAQAVVKHEALKVALEGSRREDIDQAKAQAAAQAAAVEALRVRVAESELIAPADGIIQTRVLEPGEIADPKKPVFNLALTQPKWVRAYVNEPQLGLIKSGMGASLFTDSAPGKAYSGWIGFISPSAEFTPKAVETEDLRTSLVYEVRIYVDDPEDELRLGMPVTARIDRNKIVTNPAVQQGASR
ncbi:MAG: efflux RND transporter periplasmic adaptor subunit [Bdellovibrionota bacterium]